MKQPEISYSLFTKPWKTQDTEELCGIVTGLGFNGIEFPLREGYQVSPENAGRELPKFVRRLAEHGLSVTSVAAATDEAVFDACQRAGVGLIRIMLGADSGEDYMESEYRMKKQIEGFLPLCERYGVKVGIQHHYGPMVSNSMELRHVLEGFDNNYVGAVWDAAHSGLAGEEPEQGLSIVWEYLLLVNLKNAFYRKINGPEAEKSEFERYFTTGSHGNCDWERVVRYLRKKGYKGVICLPAEYSDEGNVSRYAGEDLAYVKSLVKAAYA